MNGSIALLYYENPAGNVTVLLQYIPKPTEPSSNELNEQQYEWADISSQESISLPAGYINNPGMNGSYTLYESLPGFKFSAPFGHSQDIGTLFFSSPSHTLQVDGISASNVTALVHYSVGPDGYQDIFFPSM